MSTIYVPVSLWEWNCRHDRCQCCGITRNRTCIEPDWERCGLETHHIVHKGQGGTDEACNLLALCWRCHFQAYHGGHRRRNLTLGNLLWVKQHSGETWDLERLIEMAGKVNGLAQEPAPLPAVYLEERKRWGYGCN